MTETLRRLGATADSTRVLIKRIGVNEEELWLHFDQNAEEWLHMSTLARAIIELTEDLAFSDCAATALTEAAVIQKLVNSLEKLSVMLANLPQSAEWLLIVHQEDEPIRREGDHGRLLLSGTLSWLAANCKRSCGELRKQRGTKSDSGQMQAVQRLAEVYERLTNQVPTHSVREHRIYMGEPQTAFTKMVEAFFLEFEEDPAKRRGFRSACMWAIKQRRQLG
ncbi:MULTISPECIES: hypothetical protein [Sphingomonas]|uniref:hypothetical protein n=1 Tax=Sphingomonas TaxID=13687 RepID=UPI00126A4A1B|nr:MULTISPECIES: hypothetical protein [Sphingomonas]